MKKDIFAGMNGCVLIIILVGAYIIFDAFTPDNISSIGTVVFFFLIGGLCLLNYRSCGRLHCKITGPGIIMVGVIALLQTLEIITISWRTIWIIFWIVLIVGFCTEFIYKHKTGTCYAK